MFNLYKVLDEVKVTISFFCEKIGISEHELNQLVENGKRDTQMDLYFKFVIAVNDEELMSRLIVFFESFSEESEQLIVLIQDILLYKKSNVPRRMLNSVERLITLADDTEKIRPGKHSLKIFFFVVCIESLYTLANINMNKTMMVIDFFDKYVSESDKVLIKDSFQRNLADEKFHVHQKKDETEEQYKLRMSTVVDHTFNTQVSVEVFARVINELRNSFAHEGDYWGFHFAEGDHEVINTVVVAENHEESKQKNKGEIEGFQRIYTVNMSYEQFKLICIRGFIQFVRSHFESVHSAVASYPSPPSVE